MTSATFSADAKRLVTVSFDKTARIWNVADLAVFINLTGYESGVPSAAFTHDGSQVVTTSWDRTVRFWDVSDGSELARVEAHSGPVYCVDFLADGKQLASGSRDATIRLSNLEVLLAQKRRDKKKPAKRGRPLRNRTINLEISTIRTLLNKATEWGLIEDTPIANTKGLLLPEHDSREFRALTDVRHQNLVELIAKDNFLLWQ